MTVPIMTMGKNLTGIDVLEDETKLITHLYPRGSGSTPSELCLDNPSYFPSGENSILAFNREDDDYAYFRLPPINGFDCAAYYGDAPYPGGYGDGWPINSQFYVGKGLNTIYNLGWNQSALTTVTGSEVAAPGDAVAFLFYNWVSGTTYAPARIYDVSLFLQRILSDTPTQWTTQPRFVVGLYSVKPSTISGFQSPGYNVPYQGPLTWCYGNLLSIDSTAPDWYTFPLQTNQYPIGWYAIVIMPYPTSNKQWSFNDYLSVGLSTPTSGSNLGHYAAVCHTGVTPRNWVAPAEFTGTPSGDVSQLAIKIRTIANDVTSQFKQSGPYPGREVKCPVADYDPTQQYTFHYMMAPCLIAWENYEALGKRKFEGTYKDDSLTTQGALLQAGAQFLSSYSQPTMTISLGAVDLYDIDPNVNWDDELKRGGAVQIIDDDLDLNQECVITKIVKMDLTQPHKIDTLEMNNIHMSTQQYISQLGGSANKTRKYQQGQTVETPFNAGIAASSTSPGTMTFYIRDVTTLTQAVRLTVDTDNTFTLTIDGTATGQAYSAYSNVDITQYLTKSHNGQPTPGPHTATVLIASS